MGSNGVLAGTRHRCRRVLTPPTRSATVGPCLPWSPQEADVRRLLQAMGNGRGRNPAGKHIPFRDGDLDSLPVPLGIQPGTFGGPPGSGTNCAAEVRQMQTPSARRRPPNVSKKTVASVTVCQRPSGPACGRVPSPVGGGGGAGNPDCHTSPAWWSCEQIQAPRARHTRPERRHPARVQPAARQQQVSKPSPSQVLEEINRARLAREDAEAELEVLVDCAVGLGIGWPEIATQLCVTRQAARQHYQRRHRDGPSHTDQIAD